MPKGYDLQTNVIIRAGISKIPCGKSPAKARFTGEYPIKPKAANTTPITPRLIRYTNTPSTLKETKPANRIMNTALTLWPKM